MSEAEKVVGILDAMNQAQEKSAPADGEQPAVGMIVGTLIGFGNDGSPHVSWPDCTAAKCPKARALCDLEREDIGCEIALIFEQGNAGKPLIIGRVREPQVPASRTPDDQPAESTPLQLELDGERVEFTAGRELVLRCGKASITLTAAGKILIKGAYVSSRSSGVNRLRGGVVHIN